MATGPTLDKLIEFLKHQVTDEDDATASYRAFAGVADSLGHHSVGIMLREIAEDEARHRVRLEQAVRALSALWAHGSTELPRLFPKTYGDWADLGMDIKEKDSSLSGEVNDALTKIYGEAPDADGAKRWLVGKAGELGVT